MAEYVGSTVDDSVEELFSDVRESAKPLDLDYAGVFARHFTNFLDREGRRDLHYLTRRGLCYTISGVESRGVIQGVQEETLEARFEPVEADLEIPLQPGLWISMEDDAIYLRFNYKDRVFSERLDTREVLLE